MCPPDYHSHGCNNISKIIGWQLKKNHFCSRGSFQNQFFESIQPHGLGNILSRYIYQIISIQDIASPVLAFTKFFVFLCVLVSEMHSCHFFSVTQSLHRYITTIIAGQQESSKLYAYLDLICKHWKIEVWDFHTIFYNSFYPEL